MNRWFTAMVWILLVGCQSTFGETMVLMDEPLEAVNISESNGRGDMNLDLLHSFSDKDALDFWERAITTARLQSGDGELSNPDYDVMVEYKTDSEGGFPAHGIHLWLGDEGEKSYFMYIEGDGVYETSAKVTEELRNYILGGE
ncbi:hypothetical protein ABN702_18050 [Bacillus haimaensis]|uniref:hypothetical protein n=1 Tax=Bacillus haimaensis TaxID=3160967 RepID=UPI003AA893AF